MKQDKSKNYARAHKNVVSHLAKAERSIKELNASLDDVWNCEDEMTEDERKYYDGINSAVYEFHCELEVMRSQLKMKGENNSNV